MSKLTRLPRFFYFLIKRNTEVSFFVLNIEMMRTIWEREGGKSEKGSKCY